MKKRIKTPVLCSALVLALALVFAGAPAEAETYTYDTLGRLTRVAYPDGTSVDYTYDANGNRVALTTGAPAGGGGEGGSGGGATGGGGGGGGGGGCFIASVTKSQADNPTGLTGVPTLSPRHPNDKTSSPRADGLRLHGGSAKPVPFMLAGALFCTVLARFVARERRRKSSGAPPDHA